MFKNHLQSQFKISIKRLRSLVLVAAALGMAVSVPIATADSYDDQIKSISNQNDTAQSTISGLQSEAATFQDAIAQLNAQIYQLQADLAANQAKQAQTVQDISASQAAIALKKNQLGADVQAMYVDGQVTTIEELAGSSDLSQYIDKQEYRTAVQNQLNAKITDITALEAKLQKDKIQLDSLIASQTAQSNQLSQSQAQQASLLAYNESQQAAFTATIRANNSKILSLKAAQAAAYRATFSGSSSGVNGSIVYRNLSGQVTCGGSYGFHCGDEQDAYIDNWGEYNRECVSFVAYYEANVLGKYVPAFGRTVYSNGPQGNANQWHGVIANSGAADIIYYSDALANESGLVGDAVYLPLGSVGHVAVVLGDLGGGWVRVGQYNLYEQGRYSEMDLKITPNLEFYHFH